MSMTGVNGGPWIAGTSLTPLPSVHAPDTLHVLEDDGCERSAEDVPELVNHGHTTREERATHDKVCAPCQRAIRNGNSSRTYHEEVIRATAGKNGPSARPTARRAQAKPAGDLTMGNRIVGIDQPSLSVSYRRGMYTLCSHHEGDDDTGLVLGQQERSGDLCDHVAGVEE